MSTWTEYYAAAGTVKKNSLILTLAVCCSEVLFISGVHLHELLEGSDIHLPEPVVPHRVCYEILSCYFIV